MLYHDFSNLPIWFDCLIPLGTFHVLGFVNVISFHSKIAFSLIQKLNARLHRQTWFSVSLFVIVYMFSRSEVPFEFQYVVNSFMLKIPCFF